MRLNLWHNILDDLGPPEGRILPAWLIIVYCLIFPVNGFLAILDRSHPYNVFTDTWNIYGIKYSGNYFRQIALRGGLWFKPGRLEDGTVTLRWFAEPTLRNT